MSGRNLIVVLSIIVFILFYLPFALYYIWKLYSAVFRFNAFLRKRQTKLSFIAAIAYLVQFMDLSLWLFVYSDFYDKGKLQTLLISIASTLHIITQFVVTVCLALRFWLITYTILLEMMMQNHDWKRVINANYQQDETMISIENSMYAVVNSMQNTIYSTGWILRHKRTFGSYQWCIKRVAIIFSFLLLLILFNEITNHYPQILPANLRFITIIFALIIYGTFAGLWGILLFLHCRSPQFSDSIFIKKELGYILQTMMFFLFIYIVFIIIFGLGISDSNVYQDSYFTEITVIFHVIAFSNMLMLYVIIFYPLQKSKQFSQIPESDEFSVTQRSMTGRELSSPASVSAHRMQSKARAEENQKRRIKLDDVLKNKYGFDAFMQHLSSEFSSENLLSMTEFIQFKAFVHRRYRHSVMNKELRKWFVMLPLDALPRSEIVYSEEFGDSVNSKRKQKGTFSILTKQMSRSLSSRSGNDPAGSASPSPRSASMKEEQTTDFGGAIRSMTTGVTNTEQDDALPNTSIPATRTNSAGSATSDREDDRDLHDNDDMEFMKEVKTKVHRLYVKYIKAGCEYEINISWELRNRYAVLMDDLTVFLQNEQSNDLAQLRDIFDDACMVMKRLIGHSFTRFKTSKYFESAKKELFRRESAKMNVIL